MKKPVIGITADYEEAGGYSAHPWYALRHNYVSAVVQAGGLPLILPHVPDMVSETLDLIDGLVIPGGAFDVDPALFGATDRHETVKLNASRTAFEMAITKKALDADKPIFGICGGEQLLAVALGGTLIQHIPDAVQDALPHEQPNPRTEAGHTVLLTEGSLLARIVGRTEIPVNSAHHQALATLPPNLLVNARAPDGVIEGFEDPARRFCLGVQWHPEYSISPADDALFTAFVQAARP